MLTKLNTDPQWLKNAFDDLGVKELPGRQHSARVLEMFETAGHPEIKDDETAWCSAAVNAWFVEAGYKGTGSLMARSWSKWGKELPVSKKAPRGSVVVFWRGSPSASTGHVALVLDDDGKTITHIGGNQGNSVSISKTPKSKVVAFRWPNTAGNSGTIKSIAGSATSLVSSDPLTKAGTAVNDNSQTIADTLGTTQTYVEQLGNMIHWVAYLAIAMGIGLAIYGAYRHYKNTVVAQ